MNIRKKIGLMADKNDVLGFARYQFQRVCYLPEYLKVKHQIARRHQGIEDARFERIKKLKNSYLGQRCFIIATGPSLTIDDLELLHNETTFGVNSIAKVLGQTSWRPTYLGIQDPFVYEKLENEIVENFGDNVFVADQLKKRFNIPERFILFPYIAINKFYINSYKKYGTKFSDNAYEIVYDGYSITYSMIEIAIYMGFKEIYLLGCDCNYTMGQKNHFIESGFIDKRAYLNHARMTAGYCEAKKYADSHDIKIVNCTRGGMLEVFPRRTLESVLEEQ